MSWANFSDWAFSTSTATANPPQWNSGSQTVAASYGGLTGPLPDLYSGASPTGGDTAGQWLTEQSGIDAALLTPNATGYSGANSGFLPYLQKSGTDTKDPGLGFQSCGPFQTSYCLLPTWQTVSVNPSNTYSPGTWTNTGLFDFNNGVVILNQQGGGGQPNNPSAFLNQYQNWIAPTTIRGVGFCGFRYALNGQSSNCVGSASFNADGRPVLFWRAQASNDCFFYSSANDSQPAWGSGCLAQRKWADQVLPD